MRLDDIIKKSRVLVNKIHYNDKAKFNKEDYFMLSVSIFIARKESIIKKNNKNNTLYFDFKKYKKDYYRMCAVIDEFPNIDKNIELEIPGIGKFNLNDPNCFNGVDNLMFPFNQKIEIENFEGTKEEENHIKRIIWIYSKLRDSFVHGDMFEFDIVKNKIYVKNNMSNDSLGSFKFDISITPEALCFLCGQVYEKDSIFYNGMNEETYERYLEIYSKLEHKDIFEMDNESLSDLFEEIDEINSVEELNLIGNIVKLYKKGYQSMNQEQQDSYFRKIVEIIVSFAGRSRANDSKSKMLLSYLSDALFTDENIYHSAMYSHMIYVMSNIGQINSDNLRTTHIDVEDDIYKKIIKKTIAAANKSMERLMNHHVDLEETRDIVVRNINDVISLMKIRNRWILNNIRNGIEHKNIEIEDDTVRIFNKVDNKSEESIIFSCETSFEDMDEFLRSIENVNYQNEELNVDEFLNEVIQICGLGKNIITFITYIKTFSRFIEDKNADEFEEEDKPPMF